MLSVYEFQLPNPKKERALDSNLGKRWGAIKCKSFFSPRFNFGSEAKPYKGDRVSWFKLFCFSIFIRLSKTNSLRAADFFFF